MKEKIIKSMITALQLTTLLGLVLLFIILYFSNSAKAEDLVIYTEKDSFYYSNVDKDNGIILPNDEPVLAEELLNLETNGRPYITRDGQEIYKIDDDRFYIESEDE